MGNIINASYKLMVQTAPDAVLVLGDTNSCLSVISAKRLHIPIFHMEAGNRCKDECLPEETNRRIVDIISDVNICYSEHARRYLAENGLPKERTYVTGSPMAEVLHDNLAAIKSSDIHRRLGLEKGKYMLLSAHREENIDTEKNFLSLFNAINTLAAKYDLPILYSCHPRSRKRIEQSGFVLDKRIIRHEPLGFHDYNCLQMNAAAVISDSGTLPEESSFFTSIGHPFPAICIRTSTERPEALDKGGFILAGIDSRSLLQAVETAMAMDQNGDFGIPVPDYTDSNVSSKVVKIIQSYTALVNKMVWRITLNILHHEYDFTQYSLFPAGHDDVGGIGGIGSPPFGLDHDGSPYQSFRAPAFELLPYRNNRMPEFRNSLHGVGPSGVGRGAGRRGHHFGLYLYGHGERDVPRRCEGRSG